MSTGLTQVSRVGWVFPCPATVSSPRTLLAAMNLYISNTLATGLLCSEGEVSCNLGDKDTHNPPCHAPRPRTDSACTLVMRSKFSRSARLADNCASCALRCDCHIVSSALVCRGGQEEGSYKLARFDAAGRGGEARAGRGEA